MRYAYANLEPDPDGGRRPSLPPNDGYLLLAEPGRQAPYALYRLWLTEEDQRGGLTAIGDELDDLLASAEMYPPALALARDEVERFFDGRPVSHSDFEAFYCERLRVHLAAQDTSGYLLAMCLRNHTG